MPPYNTRSAARKRALERAQEPYKNATGKGTNVQRTHTPDEEVPALTASNTLESESSSGRPVTPDQDEEVEEFQRSPTACSTDLPEEPTPSIVDDPMDADERYRAADQALAERMFTDLLQRKAVDEDRLQYHRTLQVESNRPGGPRVVPSLPGPKLPVGVSSFGRTGTWVNEDVWRPNPTPSTDQLPSIREIGEEKEVAVVVQNPLVKRIIRQDIGGGDGVFRSLTPLPSFVTRNGVTQVR